MHDICPDCGKTLTGVTQNGILLKKCDCGYQVNTKTGEEARQNFDEPFCALLCPNCGGKNRMYYTRHGFEGNCCFCGSSVRIPAQPDPSLRMIVTCPHCSGKNRVPANKGMIKVDCGHCGSQFLYRSGIWPSEQRSAPAGAQGQPKAQPRPQAAPQQPRPEPEPKQQPAQKTAPQARPQGTPCRTITIERNTHAYKEWDLHGLENAFRDKWPVRIVLDDVEQGKLAANETMTLHVDSGEHTIRYNLLAPKYWIPPGTENYMVSYFRDNFRIGPEEDEFRDALTMFVLKMFRGQGIKDRILDNNNSGNKIYLDINPDGIRLYWTLAHTKGLKQMLTGEGEEKISYRQMGLTPLAEEKRPAGYWEFLQMWVELAILQDKEADMDKVGGGFTFRTRHDLF